MRATGKLTALACVLAFAPLAAAGTPEDPDVPGTPDFDPAYLDFVGAWFESAPQGLAFSVRVRSADAPPTNADFGVSFLHDGARVTAAVVFDSRGALHSHVGPPNWNANRVGSPDALGSPLDDEEFLPGTPAIARAVIPWDALPGLSPGDTLRELYAGTGSYSRGGWSDEDGRSVENTYVVERTYVPLTLQRHPVWVLAATTILGAAVAGGGYLLWRRRSG